MNNPFGGVGKLLNRTFQRAQAQRNCRGVIHGRSAFIARRSPVDNDLPCVMDQQRWNIARARLDALRLYPPPRWDETAVSDYNDILAALHTADPSKDFTSFRVPPGEPAPIVTGFNRGTRRAPGKVFYSSKLYCDTSLMLRRVEGVTAYLSAENLAAEEAAKPMPPAPPGWFKSQLYKARDGALPGLEWVAKIILKYEAKKHGIDL